MNRARNKISKSLSQGWRIYGTRAHNRTRNSILSQFFFISFAQPASLYCEEYVYIGLHVSDWAQSVHESPLLRNNTASEIFLHKSGAVRSDDWIFIAGVLTWRWLGEYVTLDKTFCNLPLTQEAVAAPVTSLSHSSRRLFSNIIILRIYYIIITCLNDNNAVINDNYGRLEDLILLSKIPRARERVFFLNVRKFRNLRINNLDTRPHRGSPVLQ